MRKVVQTATMLLIVLGLRAAFAGPAAGAGSSKVKGTEAVSAPPPLRRLRETADDRTARRAGRAKAVFLIWRHYVKPGTGAGGLGRILGKAAWLKEAHLEKVEGVAGSIPVKKRGSIFQLRLFPDGVGWSDWVVYFVLSGIQEVDDASRFLMGKTSGGEVKLLEFALCDPWRRTENYSYDHEGATVIFPGRATAMVPLCSFVAKVVRVLPFPRNSDHVIRSTSDPECVIVVTGVRDVRGHEALISGESGTMVFGRVGLPNPKDNIVFGTKNPKRLFRASTREVEGKEWQFVMRELRSRKQEAPRRLLYAGYLQCKGTASRSSQAQEAQPGEGMEKGEPNQAPDAP